MYPAQRRLPRFNRLSKIEEQDVMSPSDENAASLIAALDRGESLPARWYTDPAITERLPPTSTKARCRATSAHWSIGK